MPIEAFSLGWRVALGRMGLRVLFRCWCPSQQVVCWVCLLDKSFDCCPVLGYNFEKLILSLCVFVFYLFTFVSKYEESNFLYQLGRDNF